MNYSLEKMYPWKNMEKPRGIPIIKAKGLGKSTLEPQKRGKFLSQLADKV
jgi:hypothetical protein